MSSQIPVTYIDESDFSEASLIILTTGNTENIEEQIIVNRVSISLSFLVWATISVEWTETQY